LNRSQVARGYALEATKLDPQNGDAWLTLGLIEYKLRNLIEGDDAVDKAAKSGKSESLCLLQKAIARYHHVRREPYSKVAMKMLKAAETMIERGIRSADLKDYYYRKNAQTSDKYLGLIRSLISQINRRTITSENAPT
jgi:tetratricopeptide (TPR) repeat protein